MSFIEMKIAMVFDEKRGVGHLINAAACIASGLFTQEKGLLGEAIPGKECMFIPITNIPILILRQHNKPWTELLKRAMKNKLVYMVFTKEAQTTISYDEYVQRVKDKPLSELDIIGIGVLGEGKAVTQFSGDLPLLR